MVMKELNLYTILESLMKMKASLTVLVSMQDDEKMFQKIQDEYLKTATIGLENQSSDFLGQKSEYLNFLERDEREVIIHQRSTVSLGDRISKLKRKFSDVFLNSQASSRNKTTQYDEKNEFSEVNLKTLTVVEDDTISNV